jgi:hypothetical protein
VKEEVGGFIEESVSVPIFRLNHHLDRLLSDLLSESIDPRPEK